MRKARLWVDVPVRERVTEPFLRTRNGWLSPGWAERRLNGRGCLAAVKFTPAEDVWHPCGNVPLGGEQFCYAHGGLTRKKPGKFSHRLRSAWTALFGR